MREMDSLTISTASRPPQLSGMFQKLAMAVKTKTFEFFADEETDNFAGCSHPETFCLLDSTEDFITDQKVVVIKPDKPLGSKTPSPGSPENASLSYSQTPSSFEQARPNRLKQGHFRKLDAQLGQSLISSVFAAVSSFEASYIQLQAAHFPFIEENIIAADRSLVSHLQRFSDLKRFYKDYRQNSDFNNDLHIGSCLEALVQENQSKLRALETVSNRLQEEMDEKDLEVRSLRKKLSEIQKFNSNLSKRLSGKFTNSSLDVVLSLRVFDSVLRDACRTTHKFSKILIELMRRAGWDLGLAANYVHPGIDYAKAGDHRYALLSYLFLGMFRGFDGKEFGLDDEEGDSRVSKGNFSGSEKTSISLRELMEHVSSNPMQLLSTNTNCQFSRFCGKKYQELIHPNMESSIFSNMDQTEVILNSWRSLGIFYESFVNMASSIWTLHKLAYAFDPVVEIFQVEKGVEFSMVYMEDVTKRVNIFPTRVRAKVGFTVVPGFKIGGTVLLSKVYLRGLTCTE